LNYKSENELPLEKLPDNWSSNAEQRFTYNSDKIKKIFS